MNAYKTYKPGLVTLTADEFSRVQELKADGYREWEAVAQVLNCDPEANFVTESTGTASNPGMKDGLFVRFF